MEILFTLAISNSVAAGVLAAIAVVCSRLKQSPQLTHALWLLVLIKLVTPPIADIPVPDFTAWMASDKVVNSEGNVVTVSLAATEDSAPNSESVITSSPDAELTLNLSVVEFPPETELPMADPGPFEMTVPAESDSVFTVGEAPVVGEIAGDEVVRRPVVPLENFTAEFFEESAIVGATGHGTGTTKLSVESSTEPRGNSASGWTSRIGRTVFFVWGFGAALSLATLLWRCFQFRKIPGLASEPEEELQVTARQFAAQLGLSRCPRVVVADVCIPPLVWGMSTRPVIVLPRTLLDTLDPDQKRAVLMHELVHVRRRDYVVRWVEAAVLSLFWWNPLAWWARRQLREAEEECCDAWVVWALPDSRKAYGQALLKTVEFLTESPRMPVVAGTAFGGSPFKRRIEMILNRPVNRTMSRGSCILVLLLAVAVLPLAAQTATDTPTHTKPDRIITQPAASEPDKVTTYDPTKPPVARRADSPVEPKPRGDAASGFPPTPRNPEIGGRADRKSGARRPEDRSSSGRSTTTTTRQLSTEEKTLEALARMEDRIMQLEKIVQSLAISQQRTIEKNSRNPGLPRTTIPQIAQPVPTNPQARDSVGQSSTNRDSLYEPGGTAANRLVAVSPDGKIVAALTSDARATQVDLFDVKTGRQISRTVVSGKGSSISFSDDKRLLIRGEKLNQVIAVPTGQLIGPPSSNQPALTPATPARTTSQKQYDIYVQPKAKEFEATIKMLEVKRAALDEQCKSLIQEGRLLELELDLARTKLEQQEAKYSTLVKAKAAEAELEQQKLAVKQASLEAEKASVIRQFAVSKLDATKTSQETLTKQAREVTEDFAKRFPNHPEARKFLDLQPKESSPIRKRR